jgi:hypothetical protein
LEIKRGTYLTAVLKDEGKFSQRRKGSQRTERIGISELCFFKTLRDPFNTANNLRKVHAENAEFTAESAK